MSPVNDAAEAVGDPQVRHRGLVADVDGDPVGPAPTVRFGADRPALRRAPRLGEHTEDLLVELGLTREEVGAVRARGVC